MKKKTTKRNFRKLPKYALGTMKTPIDMGYLKASGIGSALFTVQPGISILPETLAIRQNTIPKALNYALMQAPFITEMLKSTPTQMATTAATTSKFVPSFATNVPLNTIQSTPGTLSNAVASTTGGKLLTGGAMQQSAGLVKQGAERAGTSAVGTTMGAIGTALGAYTMANQIADFGSHRTGLDMMLNVGRQQYSTDYGNSYTNYTGVNAGQELDYESANARSKQLGFGVNAIGTGASLGGLLGSAGALGSITGPLGTALGAGVGLLLGGLGSLLGWGNNEEEVQRLILLTNDNIAMYNREQEAVAKSKDVAAEFNNRLGVAAAATGKGAYLSMDKFLPTVKNKTHGKDVEILQGSGEPKVGVATSMGEDGEGAYDFVTKQGNIILAFEKGKGDAQPLYHTDGDSTAIFSKKLGFADIANPYILDTLRNWNIINNMKGDAQTLQVLKAVAMAKIEKNDMKLREINNALNAFKQQMEMKKYKNGKLPGYEIGKNSLLDYAFPTMAGLHTLAGLYNEGRRVENGTFPIFPGVPTNLGAIKGIDLLGTRHYDERPELDDIDRDVRYSLFNINRAGLNAGAKAAAKLATFIAGNKAKGEVFAKANRANNEYVADYANAIRDYGNRMQDLMVANNAQRMALWQQQNAAKENWLTENTRSKSNVVGVLAKDLLGANQFHRAQDYQERMLKLYGQLVENDADNAKAQLALAELARLDREASYREAAKQAAEKTYPTFANYGTFRPDGIWNAYGAWNPIQLSRPKPASYFGLRGFKDGKGGFVSRGTDKGVQQEEIQPGTLFGIGEPDGYSVKLILPEGDTVYQKPGILNGSGVIRKKGEPASKEYIKAKLRHERLLKNATPSYNIGMDQLLRLFGF